jgi:hypothetical protein
VIRALTRSLLSAAALGLAACAQDPRAAVLNAAISKLQRDNDALKQALDEAKAGTLLRSDNVLIGVHENAVNTLFGALLPNEFEIGGRSGGSKVVVQIDKAVASFDGGLGEVQVHGRSFLKDHPRIAAELFLSGGFSEPRIDPESRLLIIGVTLDSIEVRTASGSFLARLLGKRMEYTLTTVGREAISNRLPPLEIPLKLDQTVKVQNFQVDPLHVQGGSFSVAVSFTRMFAVNKRLWLQVKPTVGKWQNNPGGP